MRRLLRLIGLLLVASLAAASPALAAPTLGYGTATVDGDFSDWTGVTWHPFDTVYDSTPTDITGGEWAAKWTANKVYMAVRVQDAMHSFKDSYTEWNARDGVEMYIHTTGTGGDYGMKQQPAQEWAVGMKTDANGSVWTTCGYPPTAGNFTPTASQFVAAGKIVGNSLYYEAAMTPFQYFGGRSGNADVVSPLSQGMTIGVDCTAVGHNGTAYTGMKYSNLGQFIPAGQTHSSGWAADYTRIAQFTLVPEPSSGILAILAAMALAGFTLRRKKG